MSAEIIEFIKARSRRSHRAMGAASSASSHSAPEFMFWAGASGCRYVHTVHSLIACPELPPCTFVLAYRHPSGDREVLAVGELSGSVASLNLAELRHRGARLGANEIHVHLLEATRAGRAHVASDIKAGLEAGASYSGGDSKVASAR